MTDDPAKDFEAAVKPLLHNFKSESFSSFTYCRQCDHLIVGFKGKLCSVCHSRQPTSAVPLKCQKTHIATPTQYCQYAFHNNCAALIRICPKQLLYDCTGFMEMDDGRFLQQVCS